MIDLIVLVAVLLIGLKQHRELQRYRLDAQRIELLLMERIADEAIPE